MGLLPIQRGENENVHEDGRRSGEGGKECDSEFSRKFEKLSLFHLHIRRILEAEDLPVCVDGRTVDRVRKRYFFFGFCFETVVCEIVFLSFLIRFVSFLVFDFVCTGMLVGKNCFEAKSWGKCERSYA